MAAASCLPSAAHCMGLGEAVSLQDTQPLTCGHPISSSHRVPLVPTGSFHEFRGDSRRSGLQGAAVGLAAGASVPSLPAPGASSACGGLPRQTQSLSASVGVPPLEMKRISHVVDRERRPVAGWERGQLPGRSVDGAAQVPGFRVGLSPRPSENSPEPKIHAQVPFWVSFVVCF